MFPAQAVVGGCVCRVKTHVAKGYPVHAPKSKVDDIIQDLIVFLQPPEYGALCGVTPPEAPVIMVAVLAAGAAEFTVRPAAVVYDASALEAPGNIFIFIYLVIHFRSISVSGKGQKLFPYIQESQKTF